MPEIAEVARIVYFIRKTLVGKTLSVVKAQDDANVFGKVGTSAAEFQKALTGKKVMSAGQQGKYFWMIMSEPPHPVMHFGMTGWFFVRGLQTAKFASKAKDDTEVWPPRFWKFAVETEEEPKVEAAFTDSRRFARIRLLDCKAEDIRNTTPLKENGPDPVIDKDSFTLEWFSNKMLSKKVPVKALMLDQANISGIGNWVGDEILYHAKLHPEQYSDTFTEEQLKTLHASILHICQTAVDLLADASKFPKDWLFSHRWGKGKKDAATTLPTGEKIIFLTVGGRTSCVVPSVQKKTGPVARNIEVKAEDDVSEELKAEVVSSGDEKTAAKKTTSTKQKDAGKSSKKAAVRKSDENTNSNTNSKQTRKVKRPAKTETDEEDEDAQLEQAQGNTQQSKKRKIASKAVDGQQQTGKRRSARLSSGGQ